MSTKISFRYTLCIFDWQNLSLKMTKKISSLEDLGGFVFSTNKEFDLNSNDTDEVTPDPKEQFLEAHLDKKNRGGKTATVIKGFVGTAEDLKNLAKDLKTLCGVGGSAKAGEIIIQGNFRDKIMEYLKSKGYKIKRVGG